MPMTLEAKWIIECDNCPTQHKTETLYGNEFGLGFDQLDEPRNDYLMELENYSDWEVKRESYENHSFLCPDCVKKRRAELAKGA